MIDRNSGQESLRIAALGDLHVHETSAGSFQGIFTEISQKADIFLLCGDLTHFGLQEEAEILGKELQVFTIPVIGVLGNHDFHSDKQHEIVKILQRYNVHFVHGTEYILEKGGKKYGFTGTKGFGGGFRPSMWGRFGEPEQKAFYDAVANEVQTLENGLALIGGMPDLAARFVVMHFSPIRETLHGELQELYPFLGSTRLEEVIDRYPVNAVFHGHAHYGYPKGRTEKSIPVYNAAYPLMQKTYSASPYAFLSLQFR